MEKENLTIDTIKSLYKDILILNIILRLFLTYKSWNNIIQFYSIFEINFNLIFLLIS